MPCLKLCFDEPRAPRAVGQRQQHAQVRQGDVAATVNGVEAEIERVDGGLSAVLCPAGENTIVFSYETPGLKLSTGVTLGAILVWLGYCGFIVFVEKKKKQEKH